MDEEQIEGENLEFCLGILSLRCYLVIHAEMSWPLYIEIRGSGERSELEIQIWK